MKNLDQKFAIPYKETSKLDGKNSYEKRFFHILYSQCGTPWTVESSLGQEVGNILKGFRRAQEQLNNAKLLISVILI